MSMTDEEIVKVVQGKIDGKIIQFENRLGDWATTKKPNWNFYDSVYRVKPEPRKVWGYMDHGDGHCRYKDSKPTLKWDEVIEFVEVIK
jgi:hypothetical protein